MASIMKLWRYIMPFAGNTDSILKIKIMKMTEHIKCPGCELVLINGVLCHELGCDFCYMFVTRECKWCGSEYWPDNMGQKFCSDECKPDYFN